MTPERQYPLSWPTGWKRTKNPSKSQFSTGNRMADKLADQTPPAKKMIAAKPLALPTPRLNTQAMAAIDARAGQIAGSMYTDVRQWLISQVLRGGVQTQKTSLQGQS